MNKALLGPVIHFVGGALEQRDFPNYHIQLYSRVNSILLAHLDCQFDIVGLQYIVRTHCILRKSLSP